MASPHRIYGRVKAEGQTSIHQGDRHDGPVYNIEPGNIVNIHVVNSQGCSKYKKRDSNHFDIDKRPSRFVKKPRLSEDHDLEGQAHLLEFEEAAFVPYQEDRHSYPRIGARPERNDAAREKNIGVLNELFRARSTVEGFYNKRSKDYQDLGDGIEPGRTSLSTVINWLRQNLIFPAVADLFRSNSRTIKHEAIYTAGNRDCVQALASSSTSSGPIQEVACAFLALLSCETTRSWERLILPKHSNEKLSLIASLVTFVIMRYLCLPQLNKQLSEWCGGSLVVQDPFLHDIRIPQAHVADFVLLEAFLKHKLINTTAAAFVEVGQFNLTLGRRNGPLIRKSDWSVKGRIAPNSKVIMAVFMKKRNAECITCHRSLTMSYSGQYICDPCGKAYGNCAAYKNIVNVAKEGMAHPRTRMAPSGLRLTPSKWTRTEKSSIAPEVTEHEEIDDDYDVCGLQNIDFHILRKPKTLCSKVGTRLTVLERQDSKMRENNETARQAHTPHETFHCAFCDRFPSGFDNEHTLRRHIDHCHVHVKRVWVCQDISESGTFLQNCRACRTSRTYDTRDDAAAHLQRVHFDSCKHEYSSLKEESEDQRYTRDESLVSMNFLKYWISETYETNVDGRYAIQKFGTEIPRLYPTEQIAQLDTSGAHQEILDRSDTSDQTIPPSHLTSADSLDGVEADKFSSLRTPFSVVYPVDESSDHTKNIRSPRNTEDFRLPFNLTQQHFKTFESTLQQAIEGDPQIARIISQNLEVFLELIFERRNESGTRLEMSVKFEELEAIDRLCNLGFARKSVMRAYIVCNDDNESAANILSSDETLN